MDVVNFEDIEQQKENIEPLNEGRSALSLKGIFSVPQTELKKQQLEERVLMEKDLENLEELDDPIQPYLDYIQWIKTNYPSGKSVESGLIQVLERCTSQFRDLEFYKNDPRYLKVWLTYAKYSDNPRDIFIYLARKEIGTSLALYYEEYANFLETNNRYIQAEQVYNEGVNVKARPLIRLQRRFEEFKIRAQEKPIQSEEPQSPAFPVRSALSLKSGSLFATQDISQSKKKKLHIFNDVETEESSLRPEGWDSLGSSTFRNKENRFESKPWAGEVLKQERPKKQNLQKVSVFQDGNEYNSTPVYKVIEIPGKKPEKVDLNFDLLYQHDEEYCVQEVLAKIRGLYGQEKINNTSDVLSNAQSLPLVSATEANTNDRTIQLGTYTSLLLASAKLTQQIGNNDLKRPSSPTATFFTNAAKDEVYSMFNQKPPVEKKVREEEEDVLIYDDYTEQITRPNLNDLTEKVSDLELKKQKQMNIDADVGPDYALSVKNDSTFLSPDHFEGIMNQPTVNPANENLKEALLKEIDPPLSSYRGLFEYQNVMDMCSTLKKSLNNRQSKHVFLNLNGSDSTFNLKSLLGEGGFASVYLAESMTGEYKAIKAQRPSSAWEFYILKQIENRLQGQNVLNSIIMIEEIHLFKDESYLILEYERQGTILDIVNLYKSSGRNVDEALVVFLTIELLNVIEALHMVGIMHGDLKPDNCMLRLENSEIGQYSRRGENNWSKKGIKLIDFGRSIDMSLFPSNIKFTSNWKTDNQDCPEMRNNEPWTYQADYYGIAGIIHTMLYGFFIETQLSDGRYKLSTPMKRYWHQDLWNPLFDVLINSKSYGVLPINNKIREQMERLERWLELNGSSLNAIIRDIETGLK